MDLDFNRDGMIMKIGFISDLHTLQNKWYDNLQYNHWGWEIFDEWNNLDILIFAGDCTNRGSRIDAQEFMRWFDKQPAKEKVMIPGNHDFFFDVEFRSKDYRHDWEDTPEKEINDMLLEFPNIHYLNDSGVELFGLKIWGSPITPWFHNWAFNRTRNTGYDLTFKHDVSDGIKKHWDLIPYYTDILITHGPPFGHGDLLEPRFRRNGEERVGCIDLMNKIKEIKPKINVFGHIHEGYGVTEEDGTTFINASCLNENYRPVNPPVIIDLEV